MKPQKLIKSKNGQPISQADPYVISSGGRFYMYSTGGDGVHVWASDTLDNFEYVGKAFDNGAEKDFWAPCVIEHNGRFYMYYSSVKEGSKDVHEQQISVAESIYPDRGFRVVGKVLPPFSIDPHVVISGDEWYMFYSVNDYEADRAGTLIVADKMLSPYKTEGKPVVVVRPTLDEEIFMHDRFRKGQHWHTLEGAFYFYEEGVHYMMYSGNCYEKPEYYIGFATAKGNDKDLRKLKWTKYPDNDTYAPLLRANEYEEGTGHNSVLKTGEEYYIVYHARDYDAPKNIGDVRTARKRRVTVGGGVMRL